MISLIGIVLLIIGLVFLFFGIFTLFKMKAFSFVSPIIDNVTFQKIELTKDDQAIYSMILSSHLYNVDKIVEGSDFSVSKVNSSLTKLSMKKLITVEQGEIKVIAS